MERIPYIAVLVVYAVVLLAHLLPSAVPAGLRERVRLVAGVGALLHLATLAEEAVFSTWSPGLPEALSACSLGVMTAYFFVAHGQQRALGILLAPLAMVALGTALVVPHATVSALDQTDGLNVWLPIHLALLFAGVAGFALSSAVGVLYLYVRDALKKKRFDRIGRLPSLESLDRIQFRSMLFGFIALTLGIGAGGALATASFQESWALDPKVLYTLAVWFWYFVALQARLILGRRGRWTANFSIVGFGAMVFSLIGLNFILASWHSYG
ncbi:MAG: cytochrome c biogenesis protein CcsA [Alphaproteobacteria bacterium]|nr:cytochrome c biogenesis protein CcsA [Alphaproteobacteria bacterium]